MTGQSIKKWDVGQGIVILFRKLVDQGDGGLVSQRTILSRCWYWFSFVEGDEDKKEGGEEYLFQPDSGGDMSISSFLQPFTGGPDQDVFCELKHGRQDSRSWSIMYILSCRQHPFLFSDSLVAKAIEYKS